MIEVIKQQFKAAMSANQKLNLTREFLQILALKIISEKKLFSQIAFIGGTSLRFLYDLRRFSEDLDFSVINSQKYDFDKIYQGLEKEFRLYNLAFEAKLRRENNIHSLAMKFTGLLKELDLSPLPGQKLSIKLEIDINPPLGWKTSNTIVNKVYMLNITHYDLPSLYAGKLHACFYRKFTKGRDFYDFIWYLGKKVKPNFILLNNAIKQTQGGASDLSDKNFKAFLLDKIQGVDFNYVKKDVERFLEDKRELSLFDPQLISSTIEGVY